MSPKGKSGPTIGSANAPLISTAGTDHVIFSKKLLFIIGAIIAATVLIFFSVEQTQIQNNLAASRVALAQNNAIEQTGAELENAKVELESEEQEYVRGDCTDFNNNLFRLIEMYKEWLDEDQEDIEMSEDEIKELQSQLLEVKDKLGAKSSVLSSQEETLNDKD